ncbi:MAG: hypothetical protein EOP84_36390 [Verrucomicrobiaceae bacterium]|nr:MAG: hypothetical protein EOP84_36390 [Verrucomicrobiaceae bacterium]
MAGRKCNTNSYKSSIALEIGCIPQSFAFPYWIERDAYATDCKSGESSTLADESSTLAGESSTLAGESSTLAGESSTLAGESSTLACESSTLAGGEYFTPHQAAAV